jgi:DNA polymerase
VWIPIFGTSFAKTCGSMSCEALFGKLNQDHAIPMSAFPSAEEFLPGRLNLKSMRDAVQHCRGCDLYKQATQAVFGEGPRSARLILLGEIPGDEEDKQGHPFVGPAGRLLDHALDDAGLARDEVYVTNAVKHFRWEPRGKRRLHKKPSARQIEACKPWLHAEILVVKPEGIVCLGATAAQTMFGRQFRITKQRGKFFQGDDVAWLMATYHPSAILRAPEKEDRDHMRSEFVHDLYQAARRLNSPAGKRRLVPVHAP